MNNAHYPEIRQFAEVFISGVQHDMPTFLKDGSPLAPKKAFEDIRKAFGEPATRMRNAGILKMTKEEGWTFVPEAVEKLGEPELKQYQQDYDSLIQAIIPVADAIESTGRGGFTDYLRDNHFFPTDELSFGKEEVFTKDSQVAVTGALLSLIEQCEKNPADASFLKGISADQMDKAKTALADAGYLLPEEASERRTKPISEQGLRGTPEMMDAIVESATEIAANISLPNTISADNKAMLAAHQLKSTIDNAETEVILVASERADPRSVNPFNSDLLEADAEAILDVVEIAGKMHHVGEGYYDESSDLANFQVNGEMLSKLEKAYARVEDHNIPKVVSKLDFHVPGMSRKDSGLALQKLFKDVKGIVGEAQEVAYGRFDGDEGARSTDGGARKEEDESAFSDDLGDDHEGVRDESSDRASESAKEMTDEEREAAELKREEKEVKEKNSQSKSDALEAWGSRLLGENSTQYLPISRDKFDALGDSVTAVMMSSAANTLAAIADRQDITSMIAGVERGVEPTMQDTMRGGTFAKMTIIPQDMSMSQQRFNSVGAKGKVTFIRPGIGILKDVRNFKAPSPEAAKKRMTNLFKDLAKDENGKPDARVINSYRRALKTTIVADSKVMADASRSAMDQIITLHDQEREEAKEALTNQKGTTLVDFDYKASERWDKTIQASATEELARVSYKLDNGKVKMIMSHSEAPSLVGEVKNPSEELVSVLEAGKRMPGNMFDPKRVSPAVQNADPERGVSAVLIGESVRGIIATPNPALMNENQKKNRPVDRHPDISLSV